MALKRRERMYRLFRLYRQPPTTKLVKPRQQWLPPVQALTYSFSFPAPLILLRRTIDVTHTATIACVNSSLSA
jgi:hypothetical protein